jgi:broad specificity phosphatase PhoE
VLVSENPVLLFFRKAQDFFMPNLLSKKGSLFLVRHGETRLTGAFCGTSNPSLSRRGRAQAASAAKRLDRFPIELCYVSPQRRAKETATIIRRHLKIPQATHADLKEIHFGAWEGLRFEAIEKKWPSLARRWAQDPTKVRIPGAETLGSLRQRIKRFLRQNRDAFLKRNILVVAHGGTLSAIVLELLGLPDRKFPDHIQPPGSLRVIRGDNVWNLC